MSLFQPNLEESFVPLALHCMNENNDESKNKANGEWNSWFSGWEKQDLLLSLSPPLASDLYHKNSRKWSRKSTKRKFHNITAASIKSQTQTPDLNSKQITLLPFPLFINFFTFFAPSLACSFQLPQYLLPQVFLYSFFSLFVSLPSKKSMILLVFIYIINAFKTRWNSSLGLTPLVLPPFFFKYLIASLSFFQINNPIVEAVWGDGCYPSLVFLFLFLESFPHFRW